MSGYIPTRGYTSPDQALMDKERKELMSSTAIQAPANTEGSIQKDIRNYLKEMNDTLKRIEKQNDIVLERLTNPPIAAAVATKYTKQRPTRDEVAVQIDYSFLYSANALAPILLLDQYDQKKLRNSINGWMNSKSGQVIPGEKLMSELDRIDFFQKGLR
jgi:hypothetical protein